MAKAEVRCPNCGTSFVVGNGGNAVTELSGGIHYLVPETVRNENVSDADLRIEALKAVGVNVDELQSLMQKDPSLKNIFKDDDPILKKISESSFIKNPELFRRWITVQTFRLLKDPKGWTHAARQKYYTRDVIRLTMYELETICHLMYEKRIKKDVRYNFFTLDDFKAIFKELEKFSFHSSAESELFYRDVDSCSTHRELLNLVKNKKWWIGNNQNYLPQRWLNCFKGAGAFYTLQNIISTHGMILPNCKDEFESLAAVETVFNDIIGYVPRFRRWDILMSVLTLAVAKTHFELKW